MTTLTTPRRDASLWDVADSILGALEMVRRALFFIWPTYIFAAYVSCALFFANRHVLMGDALSRVASAWTIAQGFQPHLAAIGFVWGPIPVVPEIPLLWFGHIWRPLVTEVIAGSIVTAAFGAMGVYMLYHFLLERGVSRMTSTVLTLGFAFNPLILIYSTNGMSEIPYIALLIASLRYFSRWEIRGRTMDLGIAAILVGLASWDRYESIVATIAMAGVVSIIRWRATIDRPLPARRQTIFAHLLIVFMPTILFFGTFILFSWSLTGTPLAQFSSVYGNSSLVKIAGSPIIASVQVETVSNRLMHLAPFLVVEIFFLLVAIYFRRWSVRMGAIAIVGLPLLFDLYGLTSGLQFDFLRYLILAIPLVVVVGAELAVNGHAGSFVACVSVVVTMGTAFWTIGIPDMALQEYPYHQLMVGQEGATLSDVQLEAPTAVAQWLDAQNLPDDSILTDATFGGRVIVGSRYPRRFATSPDRNYFTIIDNPYQHGIRYVITVPTNTGAIYPINEYYPTMFDGCVPNTQLVFQATGLGRPSYWRVYKIDGPISPSSAVKSTHCTAPLPPNVF